MNLKEDMRYCWECKHLWIAEEVPGYSEMTPGLPPELKCLKGYFSISPNYRSKREKTIRDTCTLKECLEMAKTCNDFEPDSELL